MNDELWEIIEPLLPEEPPKPKSGKPRVDDRAALTGIPWEMLPRRGLRKRRDLLATPQGVVKGGRVETAASGIAGPIERGRPYRLGAHLFRLGKRPRQRGPKTGPNPADKGKVGTKRHVVVDRGDIPLSVMMSAANVHDSMVFEELVGSIDPIKILAAVRGSAPRNCTPTKPTTTKVSAGAEETPHQEAHSQEEGREFAKAGTAQRWVVERALAWLAKYRRLTIRRYERRDDIHEAFLGLGCSLICLNYLM